MILGKYSGFGAVSPSGVNCPAGGDWGSWCDCMFPTAEFNAKCRSTRPFAPWTVVGAAIRGIPHTGSADATGTATSILGTISSIFGTGSQSAPVPVKSSEDGFFGIPTSIAVGGSALLLIGTVAFVNSRKRKKK